MVEQQTEKKGPFSPLQTGCAFLMLTNMLIYLGVIAFVFNMLDPAKLDADYLAKRGFTTKSRELESPEDQEFRHLKKEKEKEQQEFIDSIISEAAQSQARETSAAAELSEHDKRPMAVSQPNEETPPSAAETPEPFFDKLGRIRAAKSQLSHPYREPEITLDAYIPYAPPALLPRVQQGYDLPNFRLSNKLGYPVSSTLIPLKTDGIRPTPLVKTPATTNDASPLQSGNSETNEIPSIPE